MRDGQLVMTAAEKELLVRLLETALRADQVEEHRTEGWQYRKLVQNEIALIESLLSKLQPTAKCDA